MKEHQHINATSGDFEYYTPDKIVEAARRTLGGGFDLDPASSQTANARIKAKRIFEAPTFEIIGERNGLPLRKYTDWGGGNTRLGRPGMDESSFRKTGANLRYQLQSKIMQKTRLSYSVGLAGKLRLDQRNRAALQGPENNGLLYHVCQHVGRMVSTAVIFPAMLPVAANELLFARRDIEGRGYERKRRNVFRPGREIVRETLRVFGRCENHTMKSKGKI